MFWIDLIFVVLFALILSSILSWSFGWRHPARREAVGASFIFLFMILVLTMWAGSAWLVPWGPVVYGTPWLALLLIGIFVSLLILAIAVPGSSRQTVPGAEEAKEESAAATAFGVFFWIVIFGLLLAVILGYLM